MPLNKEYIMLSTIIPKKIMTTGWPVVCLSFLFLFLLCVRSDQNNNVLSSVDKNNAIARLSIHIGSVGVLSKQQTIDLRRLILTLTSPGEATIHDTTALSGTGGSDIKTTIGNLAAPKSWKLAAATYDKSDSLIHSGSVDFSTVPADTVDVSLDLDAKYSILRVSFNGIPDSVKKLLVSIAEL